MVSGSAVLNELGHRRFRGRGLRCQRLQGQALERVAQNLVMAAQHAENGLGARPLCLHIVDTGVPDRIQHVDDEELVRGPGEDEAGRLDGPRQDSPGREALDEILENCQWRQ